MSENKEKGKIYELYQKARNKNRKCFLASCNKNAIKSHLIQENGILNNLTDDNHLYEFNTHKYFDIDLKFQKKGIGEIMTFKGFCNEHDTSLFKEIEMIDTDFSIYKNQLILTYKAISNEFRKKEVLLDWYGEINNLNNQEIEQLEKKIANSGKIYKEDEYDLELCYNKKIHFEEFIKNTNISLKTDLMFYLNELDYELKEQSNRYLFFYKKIPYFEVVTSSTFQLDSFETMHKEKSVNSKWEDEPLNALFFHLLPQKNYSIAIWGFHKNFVKQNLYYFAQLAEMSESQILKEISDILIERIETWACSQSFHKTHIEKNEDHILELFENFLDNQDFYNENKTKINMFEP